MFSCFMLDDRDKEVIDDFKTEHSDCPSGSIGEKYTYTFIPTGLGTITQIKCSCGSILDVTDYDNW